MKTVADALGVSRSNLIERLKAKSKPRGPYNKVKDAERFCTSSAGWWIKGQPMAIGGWPRSSIAKGEPPISLSSTPNGFIAL